MKKTKRVYAKEFGSYGVVSLDEFNNDKLATISVEFYKNRSLIKEAPDYKLASIEVINKINLK